MRVRDLVVRTRRNQELIVAGRVRIVGFVEPAVIEREATLKPASNVRIVSLPASPFCERRNRRQIVATAQLLEREDLPAALKILQ